MQSRRQKRLFSIIAVIVLMGGAISAMLYALSQNINLFYTPGQLVLGSGPNQVKPEVGQRLRLGGMVVPGTVQRDATSLRVRFDLTDDTGEIATVEYEGILPDLFREGQGIVAQGTLKGPTLLLASEVLAKHDEEYMPPEVAAAVKGIRHIPPSQWQQNRTDGAQSGYGTNQAYGSGYGAAAAKPANSGSYGQATATYGTADAAETNTEQGKTALPVKTDNNGG